jgi:hypothetical protein
VTGVGRATKQRIRATLRSAITSYMKQHPGALDINPAALVDLPPGRRPRPLVWTVKRTRHPRPSGDHLPEDPRVRASSPRPALTRLRFGEMRSRR